MKKLLFIGIILVGSNLYSQEIIKLDSIVVLSNRAGKNTPLSFSNVSNKELQTSSSLASVPLALDFLPSVVTSTEGGTGLGYSSIRVRGSDASRINVTLNGIALNDAESQEVFWVNIPAFVSYMESIQLQRGVGTSTNGPGSFGATLSLNTLNNKRDSYALSDFSLGSFNTFTTTIGAGTGINTSGFSFDIRYSKNLGEGYIRNAKTNLSSVFSKLSYTKGTNTFVVNYISGDQKSGITWNGISKDQMKLDRRHNSAGEYYDVGGNLRYYENETDNYIQQHLQLIFIRELSKKIILSTTGNYTYGNGYYENYLMSKKFSKYNIPNQVIGGAEYSKSDLITRQYLDNDLFAISSNLIYTGKLLNLVSGVALSNYVGDHFGKIIWAMYNQNIGKSYEWYTNKGIKKEASTYVKGELKFGQKYTAFLDIQYRGIRYSLDGEDKDFVSLKDEYKYNFINPKAGLFIDINDRVKSYISLSIAHREPGRSDIKEFIKSRISGEIKPEALYDTEFGVKYLSPYLRLSANLYLMEYKDQLVPTGKLSETGYVIRENVKKSYRRGLELEMVYLPSGMFELSGNITLSSNKILNYTQWIDLFDSQQTWEPLPQRSYFFTKTNIAYSPSVIAFSSFKFRPNTKSEIVFSLKHIGKQYYDNTSNETYSIPAYTIANLHLRRTLTFFNKSSLDAYIFINNLFNKKYFSNAWIYRAEFSDSNESYVEEGLYPQATTNFSLKLAFKF